MIAINKIDRSVRFDALESTIQVGDMIVWWSHELADVFTAYRNNNLFTQKTFGGYVDVQLRFDCAINSIINVFNLLR